MKWTAICVNLERCGGGDCEIWSTFSFVASHSKEEAFAFAQEQTVYEVIAIIPGDHPVYALVPDV